MNLGKKIRMYREKLKEEFGTTQKSIADEIGVDVRTLQNYEKDETTPDAAVIAKLAKIFNTTPQELLSDNENVVSSVVSNVEKNVVSYQNSVVNPSNLKKSHKETSIISIPYFEDTYASAGSGVINYDEAPVIMDFDEEFLRKFLRISGNIANIHIINARGDSMEPTIANGELLFINPMQNESGIIGGCIYIISYDGDIYVKRVEKNPVTKSITLFSDNDKYEPILIEKHNMQYCHIIGRVVSHMKKA